MFRKPLVLPLKSSEQNIVGRISGMLRSLDEMEASVKSFHVPCVDNNNIHLPVAAGEEQGRLVTRHLGHL